MEAAMFHSSPDQSVSVYRKQVRNTRKINGPFISRPSDQNMAPSSFHGGLLPPPSLSYSFPHPQQRRNHYQPPLLPLPVPNNNLRSRGLSCPPVNRKTSNRTKHQSLAPKKSKPLVANTRRGDPKMPEGLIIASTTRLGPDPKDLPKDVSIFASTSPPLGNSVIDKFSGPIVFTSPPPSSLPLPTFSLRPKLSCKAKAAGFDAGATDNLRRILRLP